MTATDGITQLRRFLRIQEVSHLTALPVSTIYELMNAGAFPRNYRLTPRIAAWYEDEIIAWQRERMAEVR